MTDYILGGVLSRFLDDLMCKTLFLLSCNLQWRKRRDSQRGKETKAAGSSWTGEKTRRGKEEQWYLDFVYFSLSAVQVHGNICAW